MPTLSLGSISKWDKKVGEKCSPGESLAQLETDKATISFDAQDEFYIAKHLVEEGAEVAVGAPIMITVEEEGDVAAFADYVHSSAAPEPPKTEAPKPKEEPAKVPEPTPAPKASPPTPPSPPPQVEKKEVASPPAPQAPKPLPEKKSSPTAPTVPWGSAVKSSPLAAKLARLQNAYVGKYGFTGHTPFLEDVKSNKQKA